MQQKIEDRTEGMEKAGPKLGARYQVEGRLAEGGSSTIWRARDLARGGALVVVKVLSGQRPGDAEAALGEFASASGLSHPNLVTALDLGLTAEGAPYLVEPLIEGPDLRSWHRSKVGGRSLEELCRALASLCRGLGSLHAGGQVHCDLKPENVIVEGGDPRRLRLLDLGLARTALDEDRHQRGDATQEAPSGTMPYLAPEVLFGEAPSRRSDLFSLGVMLQELLCGALPARSGSGAFRPAALPARYAALGGLVAALVATSAEDRPATAAAVLRLCEEATGLRLALSPSRRAGEHFPTPSHLGSARQIASELTAAASALGDGRRREAQLVLIHGPAGAGKSRLIREVARRARVAGLEVVEHDSAASQEEPVLALAGALGAGAAQCRSAGAGAAIGAATEALLSALEARPILAIIDGLSAEQALTTDALHYLLLRLAASDPPPPLLVIVTVRNDQLDSERLVALGGHPMVRAVTLERLDREALTRLVAEVLPEQEPDPGFVLSLMTACGGLPGEALEILRELVASGALPDPAGRWPELDEHGGICDEREKRLERLLISTLEPSTRRALEGLAVLGEASRWGLWQAALGDEVPLKEIALEGLIRAGLVVEEQGAEPRYSLARSALARELVDSAEPGWRVAARERIIEAFLGRPKASAESLARHLAGVGRSTEAATRLLEAARIARAGLDTKGAVRLADDAARLAASAPNGLRREIWRERVSLYRVSGRLEAALEALADAETGDESWAAETGAELLIDLGRFAEALERLEGSETLSAEVLRAKALQRLGRPEEAAGRCRDALSTLPPEAAALGAELHHIAGLCAYSRSDYDEAERALGRSLELHREAGGGASIEAAHVRNSRAMTLSQRGDLQGASLEYQGCLELALALGDPRLEATYRMNLATVEQLRGGYEAALEGYRRAIELSAALGLTRLEARARLNQGTLLTHLGATEAARRQLEAAGALAEAKGFDDLLALAEVTLAEVGVLGQDWALAASALDRASARPKDPVIDVEAELLRARLLRARRRWEAGQEATTRALTLAREHELATPEAQALLLRGAIELERHGGDRQRAEPALSEALAQAEQLGLPEVQWQAHYLLWRLHTESGEAFSARGHQRRATELLEAQVASIPPGYRDAYRGVPERREASTELERASQPGREPGAAEGARRFRHLLEITKELVAQRSVSPLLERILDRALELTGAGRAFVILTREDALDVVAARYMDAGRLRDGGDQVSRSIAEEVIRTGHPVHTVDAAEDSRFDTSRSVQHLRLRSILCLPLHLAEGRSGALYLDNHLLTDAFGEQDRELVAAFAAQVSIAINNAWLHEEAARHRAELEEKNQQIETQRAELEVLVERRTLELEEVTNRLRQHTDELVRRYQRQNLIGASKVMREVFALIDRIADSAIPVFIHGESGTGKELCARAIHASSPRRQGAFVVINCAAIPGELLESELFGHVRGAFTGAIRDKPGLFELADGGTLFLDEIGDMDLRLQAKLLRVLQERTFRRVGDERERRSDVRIVSASHHDLSQQILRSGAGSGGGGERGFREDLYYRLNVVQLDLPALRDRREDIPLLVEHFLARHAPRGCATPRISADALERLLDYGWPGNVRELDNEIQRAVVLGGPEIALASLSTKLRELGASPARRVPQGSLREAIEALEREMILGALERADGNVSRSARQLGLDRVVLYRKMGKLGITPRR